MQADLVDRLREVKCDREPFSPAHAGCVCRLANEAATEIERLHKYLGRMLMGITSSLPHELMIVNDHDGNYAVAKRESMTNGGQHDAARWQNTSHRHDPSIARRAAGA